MYVFSSKTGQEFGSPIVWGASIAVVTRKTLDRYSTDIRPNNNQCHDQYSVDVATDTYIYIGNTPTLHRHFIDTMPDMSVGRRCFLE